MVAQEYVTSKASSSFWQFCIRSPVNQYKIFMQNGGDVNIWLTHIWKYKTHWKNINQNHFLYMYEMYFFSIYDFTGQNRSNMLK